MNIIEGIHQEANRLRNELIPQYQEIGPAGAFGIAFMRSAISEGEAAIASGDTVRILLAYQSLKDFKS